MYFQVGRITKRAVAMVLCLVMVFSVMAMPVLADETAAPSDSSQILVPGGKESAEFETFTGAFSAGEGVVIYDQGETIYQNVQTLQDGKNYIIASHQTSTSAATLSVLPGSYMLSTTERADVIDYDGGAPYIAAPAANNYNVWRFVDAGDGTGYLVSACTDTAAGYNTGTDYYLAAGADESTLRIHSSNHGGVLKESDVAFLSAKWKWNSCLNLDTLNAYGETLWLGFAKSGDGIYLLSDSQWSSNSHYSTFLYEEIPYTATAAVAAKAAYVDVGAVDIGANIMVTWSTGKTEYVPITADMLSVGTESAGVYNDVTVTYKGHVICSDFTLSVGQERPNSEAVSGKYYYRLTNTLKSGGEYLFVSRNSEGAAVALQATGSGLKTVSAGVRVTLDHQGVPCIAAGDTVDNSLKWGYGITTASTGEWAGEAYGWFVSMAYPGNYLNSHAVINGKYAVNITPWEYPGGELGDIGAYGTSFWSIDSASGTLRAWCVDDECRGEGHEYGRWEYLNCANELFDSRYICAEGCQVYIYEKVNVEFKTYSTLGLTGKIPVGAELTSDTGSKICITYSDGSFMLVPVTVDMLYFNDGTALTEADVQDALRITGLDVKYNGFTVADNYTLDIVGDVEQSYPNFPEPGSVLVDKQLGKSEYVFSETGVSRVDVTVNGVPMNSKLDVLIIVDTSSSVGDNYVAPGVTRVDAIRDSVDDLIAELKAPHPDGTLPDVYVALSEFNDYTYFEAGNNSLIDLETGTQLEPFADRSDENYNGQIVGFTNIHDLSSVSHLIRPHAGTNYDVAFQDAYEILSQRRAEYETIGEREQIVVFMSDGICFQYNYMSYRHGAADSKYWEGWMLGTLDEMDALACVPEAVRDFYHPEGRHWMAEAIKGEPGQGKLKGLYPAIWNDAENAGVTYDPAKHSKLLEGLGATIYTIGFGLSVDGSENAAAGKQILTKMASDSYKYYETETADELHSAFVAIGETVRRAATNAYVMDQMGDRFDLQMGTVVNSKGQTLTTPSITISAYDMYRIGEVGTVANGVTVTEDMVGTRKSNTPSSILETITFNADGTEAYSDKLSGNILTDGVICGKYFYYNTNKYVSSSDTGVAEIVINNKTIQLPAETIYWRIGEITEQQLELSYYVYLENSMGEDNIGCEMGTYDTNNYADLHYTNYLNETCVQHTVTPVLPWKTAAVSYAFYLVDEDGNVIVNDITGETGSFNNRIPVTLPVTEELHLNVDGTQRGAEISAKLVMPDGYTLFDPDASYTVHVNSGEEGAGGSWEITGESGTTYVTGYGDEPTNEPNCDDVNAMYNNTTVWFAVVYTVKAMPDTVVIDYGIPVDIDVLGNDQFPDAVTIDKLCQEGYETVMASTKSCHINQSDNNQPPVVDKITKDLYTAELLNADGQQTIRFTLNKDIGMQMNTHEVFAYRVPYTYVKMVEGEKIAEERYYFSTVTVIPATTIYYEDDFLTYRVYQYDQGEDTAAKDITKYPDDTAYDAANDVYQWTAVEEALDAIQAQDRPGKFSFADVDANNIYGFDGAYQEMSTYSLGSAMKFTASVTAEGISTYGTAEFTFYGTGFDIVSLTNDTTGVVLVEVRPADGTTEDWVARKVVDTYYGYKYDGENWVVDANASDTLYQVPVLKISDLEYGKYTAVITVSYSDFFDHKKETGTTGSYDFYLDAIRIYDPANDGVGNQVIEDAYVADKEGWPEYFELRNLLIHREDLDYNSNDASVSIPGVVFIDNTANKQEFDVSDYTNYGPNNELYLAPGQVVAFNLNVPGDVAGVHLAMKSVGGTTKIKCYTMEGGEPTKCTEIKTATDLYYDISGFNGQTVIIRNVGESSDAILSITNVKVTYNSAHSDSLNKNYVTVSAPDVMDVLGKLNNETESTPNETESAAITMISASLSLENEVMMNFYFKVDGETVSGVSAADMGLLLWNQEPAEGMATYGTADSIVNGALYSASDDRYMVHSSGISAKNMGDDFYVRVYVRLSDGSYIYGKVLSYSPKTYAMSRLEKSSNQQMKALCVAMLNYGAAAQQYFGYETDALMNADLTAEQQALVEAYRSDMMDALVGADSAKAGEFVKTEGAFGENTATVSFDSPFCINFYFKPAKAVDSKVVFYYWTAADYTAAETLTADNASGVVDMTAYDENAYWAPYTNIAAKEMDDTVYVCGVYESEGVSYCTGVIAYSVAHYCEKFANNPQAEMYSLCRAAEVYGYYAKCYFEVIS